MNPESESHRDRLERELVHRYRAQHAHDRKGNLAMAMQTKAMRWAGVAVVLALGVVACTTPTSTDREMGKQIQFSLPADLEADASTADQLALRVNTKQVLHELRMLGYEDVNVGFRETVDGGMTVDLTVFDDGVDADRMIRHLSERFASLRAAEVDVRPLHTVIEEPLYAKFSRDVLKIEVGGDSDAEIKARILAELQAKGIDSGSVEVHTEGGITTIDMSVDDPNFQTHDVIDLKIEGTSTVEVPVGGPASEDGVVQEEVRQKN